MATIPTEIKEAIKRISGEYPEQYRAIFEQLPLTVRYWLIQFQVAGSISGGRLKLDCACPSTFEFIKGFDSDIRKACDRFGLQLSINYSPTPEVVERMARMREELI